VAAASDLAAAMPELATTFEERTGIPVTTTLGASGQLAAQIRQGAPVDVFLSADAGWVDQLDADGWLDPASRTVYALGTVVLLASSGAEPPASMEVLRLPGYRRVALANPEHAPYGRAAHQALERAGLLPELQPRLVLAENARQTVQFAERRAVDVALTARSLMDSNRHRWTNVPPELYDPLQQTAAVVARSARPDQARAFVAFLATDGGRAVLERYGFQLP
jgi:molybdate transport system substrate-binding protein